MKFNNSVHFEISASEVKDIALALAQGFIKIQEWKDERDAKVAKESINSIKPKVVKRFKTDSKRDMDRFNRQHAKNLTKIRSLVDNIDKKTNYVESKCGKKSDDIDIATLPDDVKRQIALDYLRKHPLTEDKQKAIADEYIRKYGVIK